MAAKSITRKHHYLPQAYLAAFTLTGTKDGQFCVFDVASGRAFRTSAGNVAHERDFNRINVDGQSPDAVESALAPFEGDAVNAIRRILENHSFPDDRDWNLVLNLLGLIAVRNPRLRESFNHSREQVLQRLADLLVSDEKVWERHIQKTRDAGEQIPDVPFEKCKSFVKSGAYTFDFHQEGNLRAEFNAFDEVLPHLGQRTWSILVAPSNGPEFICSDHPVTLTSKDESRAPHGYASHKTEIFFPLGRRVGFYGVYETPLKPVVNCRPMNVAIMNMRVMNCAERHVYSALNEFSAWRNGTIEKIKCEV